MRGQTDELRHRNHKHGITMELSDWPQHSLQSTQSCLCFHQLCSLRFKHATSNCIVIYALYPSSGPTYTIYSAELAAYLDTQWRHHSIPGNVAELNRSGCARAPVLSREDHHNSSPVLLQIVPMPKDWRADRSRCNTNWEMVPGFVTRTFQIRSLFTV